MTDEVTVDADTVTLRSGGRVLDTQRRDALGRDVECFKTHLIEGVALDKRYGNAV
jgi:hypothetical protein